jgi:hypothetical protein
MGNRAVIQFGTEDTAPAVYLHWNGGRASVKAFLAAARELGVRDDPEYACARLSQIIGNWFGGTLSLGAGAASDLDRDNYDNGTYVVYGWQIVDRLFFAGDEDIDPASTAEILRQVLEINRPIFAKGD